MTVPDDGAGMTVPGSFFRSPIRRRNEPGTVSRHRIRPVPRERPDARRPCYDSAAMIPNRRTVRTCGALFPILAFLLLSSTLHAQDPLEEVRSAHAGGDAAALKALAERESPDPWNLADALCSGGEHDVALAFARASSRKAAERLPAYVESLRGDLGADAARVRRIVIEAQAFLGTDPDRACAMLAAIEARGDHFGAAGAAFIRGSILDGKGRPLEAASAWRAAGEIFERIGHFVMAAQSYCYAASGLSGAGQHADALPLAERALPLSRAADSPLGPGRALLQRAFALDGLGKYAEAEPIYLEVFRACAETPDVDGIAGTAAHNLGALLSKRGEHAEAIVWYERALPLRAASGRNLEVRTLCNIAISLSALGKHVEAGQTLDRALTIAEEAGDGTELLRLLWSFGSALAQQGRVPAALDVHRRRADLAQRLSKPLDRAESLRWIAFLHYQMRELAEAERTLDDAARALGDIDAPLTRANMLTTRGLVLELRGDYLLALDFHRRALAEASRGGDRLLVSIVEQNRALTEIRLGRLSSARKRLEECRAAFGSMGERQEEARTLSNLAAVLLFQGEPEAAERAATESLGIREALRQEFGVALTLLTRAEARQQAGNLDGATADVLRARDVSVSAGLGFGADIASALGDLGHRRGDLAAAERHFRQCIAEAEAGGVAETILGGCVGLGRALLDLKRPEEAATILEKAPLLAERAGTQMRALGGAEGAAGQLAQAAFGLLAEARIRQGRLDEGLWQLERARARALLDLLERSRSPLLDEAERRARDQGDGERVRRCQRVREQLAALAARLERLSFAQAEAHARSDEAAADALRKEAREVSAEREEALQERLLLVQEFVKSGTPATADAIRGALRKGERLLYYALSDEHARLLLVPPPGEEMRTFVLRWPDGTPVTERKLAEAVSAYAAALARPDGAGAATAGGRGLEIVQGGNEGDLGARLYAALVPEEVRAELKGLDRIFAIPHGPLHRLPLETLVVGTKESRPVHWLGAYPPVCYTHSASVLLWCRQRKDAQRTGAPRYQVVALGDPVYARSGVAPAVPERGALVVAAPEDGPARRAGIVTGDVVLAYDSRDVGDAKELGRLILGVQKEVEGGRGGGVVVRCWRAGTMLEVTLPAGPLGVELATESPREAWERWVGVPGTVHRGFIEDRFGPLPPLPGTRREVESIRQTFGEGAVASLFGEEATEPRLFDLAPQARFLHLATHHLVDEMERFGHSGLALTAPRLATPSDDGFLGLAELFEHWRDRLAGCELVVLSACETHGGPLQRDEGPYSLPLGFLHAGAPAVIASLWRVDDATTAELMADFYRRVKASDGRDKLKAFTEARASLRERDPDPSRWAPFVYIGDPR